MSTLVQRPRTRSALQRRREENIRHTEGGYHDHKLGKRIVSIVVGGCLVSGDPDVVISTTLGSCVACCLFDPVAGMGGMNHFLLAESADDRLSASARYGAAAMEQLINRVLGITGRRDRLRAKVFGGGHVTTGSLDIGNRNVEFVMEYLAFEGIPTMGWDVGGGHARAIRFYPSTGRTQRRLLGADRVSDIVRSEASFLDTLAHKPVEGDVELF
ncbi:chemotaxis protein [Azospirillum sp.]|uniref:chemotaxis protein n=1 Tax=Azospirillum sp. TaxID=34012 RepID=UPI002D467788|nr:chemotaxis protein [Azospirillum sp.]HYD70212.1 chemotaxis protein [Azospirillum sp.]